MKTTECPICGTPIVPSFGTTSRCDCCLRIFEHTLVPAGYEVNLKTTEQGRLLDKLARLVVESPDLPGHENYSALLIAAWRSNTEKFDRIMSDHKQSWQEEQK